MNDCPAKAHVVIMVHGIRTFGGWCDRLEHLIRSEAPDTAIRKYQHKYFTAIGLMIPLLRRLAVRRFRRDLIALAIEFPGAEFDIVGHSFGTYLVGRTLATRPSAKLPRIGNLILAGSILKSHFSWIGLPPGRKPVRVINECGRDDNVLLFGWIFGLSIGMAGRYGFHGMVGGGVLNRFYRGGHDLYFDDGFMEKNWVPVLARTSTHQVAPQFLRVEGPSYRVQQGLELLKIVLSLALLVGVPWSYLRVRRSRMALNLASQAQSFLTRDGEGKMRGLLLAIECTERFDSPECDRALEIGLEDLPRRLAVSKLDDGVLLMAGGRSNALFVIEGKDGLSVLNLNKGDVSPAIEDELPIDVVALSKDGENGFYSTIGGRGVLWETKTGRRKAEFLHEGNVVAAAFTPSGSTLFTVVEAGPQSGVTLYSWDVKTGRKLKDTELEIESVSTVAFSPDARVVVTAQENPKPLEASTRLWDTATGEEFAHVFTNATIRTLAVDSDTRWLAGGDDQGTVHVWDIRGGREQATMSHPNTQISQLAFGRFESPIKLPEVRSSGQMVAQKIALQHELDVGQSSIPRGLYVAAAASDNTITVWEVMSGRQLSTIVHRDDVKSFAFGPYDLSLYTFAGDEFEVWESEPVYKEQMKLNSSIVALGLGSHENSILALGKNGDWIAWEAKTGFPMFRVSLVNSAFGHPNLQFGAFNVSPDWTSIAGVGGAGETWLWDALEGVPVDHLPAKLGTVTALATGPAGRWLAFGTQDGAVSIFDMLQGAQVRRFELGSEITSLSLNDDGLVAAGGSNGVTRIWSIPSGLESAEVPLTSPVVAISIDPRSRWLAISTADNNLVVTSISDSSVVRHLKTAKSVSSLAFGSGNILAFGGTEVEILDVNTGHILAKHQIPVNPMALQFIDGDDRLLIASGDSIDPWLWNRGVRIAEACSRTTRNLTPTEWKQSFEHESYRPTCGTIGVQQPTSTK